MIDNLRDYQRKAIEDTYEWLGKNGGNPCIVAPTGSGKSWIIAGLCEDIMNRWKQSRIIVLSHVKELLQQDADKILAAWPGAPLGIYSAGLGRKDVDAVTVAGIQSIYRKAGKIGKADLVIVDEAHRINNESCGMYRRFLTELEDINPHMRIIGLTATPYRLGQGMVTEGKNAIFDALIESVTIEELVKRGYLAPLRNKLTETRLNVEGVKVQGGDYVKSELEAQVNTRQNNDCIVTETLKRGEGRNAVLVFCCGITHAEALTEEFRDEGVTAEIVTGETPSDERARILEDFKAGRIRVLTNVNVLTTGFDYPNIDLIVMARPTLSPGLYMQMAGRGMRLKDGINKDCLVLDFAGNIARHGPITAVTPPKKRRAGRSVKDDKPKVKECPECHEGCAPNARVCPCCGYEFPMPTLELDETVDIMGRPVKVSLRGWHWQAVTSKTGIPMLKVDFYTEALLGKPISVWLCVNHGGYAQMKATQTLSMLVRDNANHYNLNGEGILSQWARTFNTWECPAWVECVYRKPYYDIKACGWAEKEAAI